MIIDFHVHYGKDLDGCVSTVESIGEQLKKNSIDKAAVFCFNNGGLVKDSKEILEISKKHNFIIPFLRFDPNKIQKDELKDLLEMGFRGVKLHPRSQQFDPTDKKFSWIFEEIKNHSLPIIIHSKLSPYEPSSHPLKILEVAKSFPDQIFVLAHCAGGDFKPFEEIHKAENVFVETSIFSLPIVFEKMYEKYNFDRFIYGSDYPYSYPEIELLKINLANIPKNVKDKILYNNAMKIMNF